MWQLLVEVKLFHNHVVVVVERILYLLNDLLIDLWCQLLVLVRHLQLVQPQLQGLKQLLELVLKIIVSPYKVEHDINQDGLHEDAKELQTNSEHHVCSIQLADAPITIANSRDHFPHPIERESVDLPKILFGGHHQVAPNAILSTVVCDP